MLLASSGNTVGDQSAHKPMFKGLNLGAARKRKNQKTFNRVK